MGLDTFIFSKGENSQNKEELYWRKSNHIHNWFAKKLYSSDEEDNCNPKTISSKLLDELQSTCQQVLANRKKADKLLPTASGFFWGCTDYDDYYFDDVERTIKEIDELKEKYKDNWKNQEFIFESWY